MKLKANQKGFTLVELLIVIVVIAILAAISIVAYNGVQDRARTTTSSESAHTVVTKAESYNTIESSYPADVDAFETVEESKLEGLKVSDSALSTKPAKDAAVVGYVKCSSGDGAEVTSWDYRGNKAVTTKLGGGCS